MLHAIEPETAQSFRVGLQSWSAAAKRMRQVLGEKLLAFDDVRVGVYCKLHD
jgi:hypothetical protein